MINTQPCKALAQATGYHYEDKIMEPSTSKCHIWEIKKEHLIFDKPFPSAISRITSTDKIEPREIGRTYIQRCRNCGLMKKETFMFEEKK